jgi:hypothetical protein
MPVSVEVLKAPLADQDAVDIQKILQETGNLWRDDIPGVASDAQVLDAQGFLDILPGSWQLIGGRFNDRLLGLMLLRPALEPCSQPESRGSVQEQMTAFEISGICVRPLTQGRSVASQMFVRVCQLAHMNDWRLLVSKCKLKKLPHLEPMVANQYFYETQEAWVWSSNNKQ